MLRPLDEEITLDRRKNHTIEVVVDRLVVKPEIEKRLEASVRTATKLADGLVLIVTVSGANESERMYSQKLACPDCGANVAQLEPRSFSFNSPFGACETCHGLGSRWSFDPAKVIVDPSRPMMEGALGPGGTSNFMSIALSNVALKLKIPIDQPFAELPQKFQTALTDAAIATMDRYLAQDKVTDAFREYYMRYMSPIPCPDCKGQRLKPSSLAVRVNGVSISDLTGMSLIRALETVKGWKLSEREQIIGGRAVDEIRNRLEFLIAVGLEYLSLERSAATLSGGEAQRIRLATQIGSRLRGVLYVLDEPSIGLHPRDNNRLLDSLAHLRDLGNTVLVVEHDAETIERADYVIDLGPGAGRLGGELVAQGTPEQIEGDVASLTGQYLSGARKIAIEAGATYAD